MTCIIIFGLIFVVYGLYSIITKKGMNVLSKRHEDVTGSSAVINGIIALVIGLVILWFAVYDLYF